MRSEKAFVHLNRPACILIAAFFFVSWCSVRAHGAPTEPPWKAAYNHLASARDELSADLRSIWTVLQNRIKSERPDLLPRLEPAPPEPLPTGYALLPVVQPDGPEKLELHEVRSSLADVGAAIVRQKSSAAELTVKLSSRTAALDTLLDDYVRLSGIFRQIDGDLNYHATWQPKTEAFKKYGELLEAYRISRALPADESTRSRIEAANAKLENGLLEFAPAPGLSIREPGPGVRVLPVLIQTDIEDDAFLRTFSDAIEVHWNSAEGMKKAGLRIIIEWDRRSPSKLYPEGPPARGAKINTAEHLTRFDPALLVLTTGAESSFEIPQAIFLSPGTTTRRVLAHEFSHLLGFSDAYLHAFEGLPEDANGVTWWEICPFPRDLMCNASAGKVSGAMVSRLLSAYGRPLPNADAR